MTTRIPLHLLGRGVLLAALCLALPAFAKASPPDSVSSGGDPTANGAGDGGLSPTERATLAALCRGVTITPSGKASPLRHATLVQVRLESPVCHLVTDLHV